MPRVDWIVACRSADRTADNLLDLRGVGIDRIQVETFPAEIGFMLGVRIVGSSDDYAKGRFSMSLGVYSPSGEKLSDNDRGEVEALGIADVDWVVPIHLAVQVRFTADSPGAYRIEVGVDLMPSVELTMFVSDHPPDGSPY